LLETAGLGKFTAGLSASRKSAQIKCFGWKCVRQTKVRLEIKKMSQFIYSEKDLQFLFISYFLMI